MKANKESGFTLIETLLVLFISSLVILMPVLSIDRIMDSIQINLFFRELTSNITLMQNHAILTGERTVVDFYPKENVIKFSVPGTNYSTDHPLNSELFLETGLYELQGGRYHRVTFRGHTGNIVVSNSKWTTNFQTNEGAYCLVFQLGSGRFDIRKN